MIFVQTIPVKPYLLRYLSSKHETDPFILSERNRYGLFIIKSLRHSHIVRTGKYTMDFKTEPMRVEIKEHYEQSYGIHISDRDMYHFNSILQDEFYEEMLKFVGYRYTGRKGEIKRALHDFCEFYKISEDDLPFRTLQKQWERQRHRLTTYITTV